MLVERGDAVVVEARSGRAEDRHVLPLGPERLAVADHLAGHVAPRVLGPAALELVDGHHVGGVEHVDLLQLRGGAVLRRHDVERDVGVLGDARVALADAGGLDDDEVEVGGLAGGDDVAEVRGQRGAGGAGGERAEVDPVAGQGVHPDPVAEQRAAALAPGRVDGEDGDAQLVLLVEPEAAQQLVGQAGLAGAAGAGDAKDRDRTGPLAHGGGQLGGAPLLQHGDRAGQGSGAPREDLVVRRGLRGEVGVAGLDEGVDHPGEAEPLAVLRREDGDAAALQQRDLLGHDDPATTAEDLHVAGPDLLEPLLEVAEVLDVPALVAADRDALRVLLQCRGHDRLDAAVVPEVDHLDALALQHPPHDVDGGVVAVEQAGRGDEADVVLGGVQGHGKSSRRQGRYVDFHVSAEPPYCAGIGVTRDAGVPRAGRGRFGATSG